MKIRKGIYFFPALIFLFFLIWASILLGIKSLEVSAILVEILFVIAGFLLSKKLIIGGVIGIFPSVYFVLSGNYSKTGIETPIGIVLFIYYLLCIIDTYMNKKKSWYNL